MRSVNFVDVTAILGLIVMLVGVWLWLGIGAAVALFGAVLLVFSVRVASNAG